MVGRERVEDLRSKKNWAAWVDQQEPSVRHMLGLAAYQFFEVSDTLCLVFPNSALRQVTEESCTLLVGLIQKHYEGRLRDWLAAMDGNAENKVPGPDLTMPHLSIEFAPPFNDSH